jgi:2-C-methyl-D-erythritol 4-phosphate cytidylyltransferase
MAARIALGMRKKAVALIVAAGEGHRMGIPRSKAFIPLEGIPILALAVRPFEDCDRIHSLYPVLREQDFLAWNQEILKRFPLRKAKPPVAGGLTRQDSVRLGLESIGEEEEIDVVLIHDGARPFLDISQVEQLLDTMEETQAAVLAVPAKETIKVVSPEKHVLETPARGSLWHIQTPQAFDFPTILEAHRKAFRGGVFATDDATLLEHMGVPVMIVQGSYRNIKITTREDLVMARALLEDR